MKSKLEPTAEQASVRELTAGEIHDVAGARAPIVAKFLIWTIQANERGYDVWEKGKHAPVAYYPE